MSDIKHNVPIVTIGLDACKGGWVVVSNNPKLANVGRLEIKILSSLQELSLDKDLRYYIGIDIPIGLLDKAEKGGRQCDQEARRILQWPRSSSVFSPPIRNALDANSYSEALNINKKSSSADLGISIQAYHIIPKIQDADLFARKYLSSEYVNIIEVHPELSFLEMAGKTLQSKHTKEGREERYQLLSQQGFKRQDFQSFLSPNKKRNNQLKEDDLLDASAVTWSTNRVANGRHKHTGDLRNQKDTLGLSMKIYW